MLIKKEKECMEMWNPRLEPIVGKWVSSPCDKKIIMITLFMKENFIELLKNRMLKIGEKCINSIYYIVPKTISWF